MLDIYVHPSQFVQLFPYVFTQLFSYVTQKLLFEAFLLLQHLLLFCLHQFAHKHLVQSQKLWLLLHI